MKYCFLIVVLFSFFFLPCACIGSSQEQERQTLVLGVMPSLDYLPLAVALREGYFDKSGLDLQIRRFYSANERDAAFQSGAIDGVVIDYSGAVLQRAGGENLRLTSRCEASFFILSGKNSGVTSIKQLKGKKVAVSRNTVIEYCLDMALASAGLPASEVERVEINKIPLRYEMLMSGQVEATALPFPLALAAETAGAHALGSNQELGISVTGIIFSAPARENKTKSIKKMYVGYNQGVDYLGSHGIAAVQDILLAQMGYTEALLAIAPLPVYRKAALPPEEDLASVVRWLAAKDLVDPAKLATLPLTDGNFLP